MPPVRWFSTIVVALLAVLAAGDGVRAQGSNAYTVSGVDVDVTAENQRHLANTMRHRFCLYCSNSNRAARTV